MSEHYDADAAKWMDPIERLLESIAPEVVDRVASSTALRGSIVKIDDEVLVNVKPMIRNILLDGRFINDPFHLGEHLGIPPMSEDSNDIAWEESDARLEVIEGVAPFAALLTNVVVATYIQAERLTGLIPFETSVEELREIQLRTMTAALASVQVVLSFLADTNEMKVVPPKEDEDE